MRGHPIPLLVALAMLAAASASTATAGDMHDPRAVVAHIFDMADADGDGRLDRAEYEKAGLERYGVSFDDADADGDGATTMTEYLELYERIHERGDELEA